MSVNEKMTAIADALRLKSNGTTGTYSLDSMAKGVLGLGYANVPAYHHAEAGRVVQAIRTWKSGHANGLVFGAISDNHVYANNATYGPDTERSMRHASFALEAVGAMAECDFLANLGDNCWENGLDTDNAMEGAKYAHDATIAAFSAVPSYRLVGNHDRSSSTEKTYSLNGVYNQFDAYGTTQIRGFGYKDFATKKVRVICLNSVDYLNLSGGCGMSYDQKDFLLRALDLSSKSDAAKWQILLLSHFPLDWNGGDCNTAADLKTILNAYTNGTTASITVNSSYAVNETPANYATYSSGKLVYSYAGKNAARIIANVHGHIHTNAYGLMSGIDVLRMATPNSCFSLNKTESYPEYGDYSITAAEAAKIAKVANSAKDTSATFYCIDLDNKTITAYAYGAGVDRVASYDVNRYTITLNLANATANNATASVLEGEAYTATITAKAGYELQSVTVTMGGTNITNTAYSNGVVNIASVTGNVVITATATETVNYTNLFSTSDPNYSVGRLNSSGAVNTSYTNGFVSGFIPAVYGDVIRAKSANTAFLTSYGVIAFYDSTKKYIAQIYINDSAGRIVMSDSNKAFACSTGNFADQFKSMAFVRVMGYGSPDGFIITKNEAIE